MEDKIKHYKKNGEDWIRGTLSLANMGQAMGKTENCVMGIATEDIKKGELAKIRL